MKPDCPTATGERPGPSETFLVLEQRLAERLLTFVLAVVDLPHFMES